MCNGKAEVHKEDNRKAEGEEMWAVSVCFLHSQVICRLRAHMHASTYAFCKKDTSWHQTLALILLDNIQEERKYGC